MKNITSEEFAKLSGTVLVDFNATWCGPCRMLHPILDEVEKEITDVKFVGIDCDDESDIAEEFNVTNIPCVVIVKDGKEVARSVGFKPKAQIEAFVNSNK
jgi:thioredoxin 1